jgi:hypothetical protein
MGGVSAPVEQSRAATPENQVSIGFAPAVNSAGAALPVFAGNSLRENIRVEAARFIRLLRYRQPASLSE